MEEHKNQQTGWQEQGGPLFCPKRTACDGPGGLCGLCAPPAAPCEPGSVRASLGCLRTCQRALISLSWTWLNWMALPGILLLLFYYYYFFKFLAALGLHCCAWAFSSCGEQGLLFLAVRGHLTAVASRCRARALGPRASVVVARGLAVVARRL